MSDFRYVRPNNFPPIVKNLIIINALIWVAQWVFERDFNLTYHLGLWPVQSEHFKPYQIFTSMFAHDPRIFGHILFNMLGLWSFGKTLENVWGSKRFLFFYIACGLGSTFLEIVITFFQYQDVIHYIEAAKEQGQLELAQRVADLPVYSVGASGAVVGVFTAFGLLFPNSEMQLFLMPFTIKAKWLMISFVALEFFGGINPVPGDNVGHWAHLGGALTGFIIVFIWNKTNRKTLY